MNVCCNSLALASLPTWGDLEGWVFANISPLRGEKNGNLILFSTDMQLLRS